MRKTTITSTIRRNQFCYLVHSPVGAQEILFSMWVLGQNPGLLSCTCPQDNAFIEEGEETFNGGGGTREPTFLLNTILQHEPFDSLERVTFFYLSVGVCARLSCPTNPKRHGCDSGLGSCRNVSRLWIQNVQQ